MKPPTHTYSSHITFFVLEYAHFAVSYEIEQIICSFMFIFLSLYYRTVNQTWTSGSCCSFSQHNSHFYMCTSAWPQTPDSLCFFCSSRFLQLKLTVLVPVLKSEFQSSQRSSFKPEVRSYLH